MMFFWFLKRYSFSIRLFFRFQQINLATKLFLSLPALALNFVLFNESWSRWFGFKINFTCLICFHSPMLWFRWFSLEGELEGQELHWLTIIFRVVEVLIVWFHFYLNLSSLILQLSALLVLIIILKIQWYLREWEHCFPGSNKHNSLIHITTSHYLFILISNKPNSIIE